MLAKAHALEDAICARVRIQLSQDVVIARNAFKGTLVITNAPENVPLENLSVTLNITEGNNLSANNLFGINPPELSGVGDVNGGGVIQPGTTASASWLLVPTRDAAPDGPVMYYVGGEFSYTQAGSTITVPLFPAPILVKPDPLLVLDYFWAKDVNGDDPLTPEIEPVEPFSLGLMVRNNGKGVANNFRIINSEPQIIENEKGLFIDFKIIGTQVNADTVSPSLTVNLGNIDPGTKSIAQWIMTSSLQGTFSDYKADFVHVDGLGNPSLSLIDTVNIHELTHVVRVDTPSDDNIPDFLAKDGGIYNVYISNNVDSGVVDQSGTSTLTFAAQDGFQSVYTLETTPGSGFIYVQLPDPFDGRKAIAGVVRSDGKIIRSENTWLSKTREHSDPWQYYFNLFDADSTGTYTVTFGDPLPVPHAPVLQFISDKAGEEGSRLSFIVQASDPDGTIPSLTTGQLPDSATFADQGNGTGIFDWTPVTGQKGQYKITFIASDGVLNDSQQVTMTINPDNTPPLLTCPQDIEILATELTGTPSTSPEIQSFLAGATAIDNLHSIVSIANNAPAFFSLGQSDVTFTATDDAGNQSTCHAAVTVKNPPPVFDHIAEQVLNEGETLVFTVSASDPNNDPLVYSANGLPSGAAFDPMSRTFIYTPGYDVSTSAADSFFDVFFSVSDGTSTVSMPVRITVRNVNRSPLANAGTDQNIQTGSLVTLDGSGSSDPDGELITFNWAQTYRPSGSVANLSDSAAPQPAFVPDVAGYYGYDLVVCDPALCSGPDSVSIYATAPNVPPNASAGPDQNVLTGLPVLLDGGVSNDPDNGPLPMSYLWGFRNIPSGSIITDTNIIGKDKPLSSFIPDVKGAYQLDIAVSDGADTTHDQVVINATDNVPPTANAGLDQVILPGQNVTFDGLGSYDPDGRPQPITYQWSFVSIPAGSGLTNANLTGVNTSSAVFTPDVTGSYVLQLAVNDGQATVTDNVAVTVIQPKANSNSSSSYFSEGGYNAYATFDVKYLTGSTTPSGSLTFSSTKTRRKVVSTGITSLTVTGKTAVFSGPCTLNGVIGYNFTATVADNATPGSGVDTFSITVTGPNGFNYTAGGTIISGDYTVSQ